MFFEILKWTAIILGSMSALCTAFVLFLILKVMFNPGFDEFGNINECIGCRGHLKGEKHCLGCEWNPEYWDRYEYKGPSRKRLRKYKKESGTWK